jgi:putative transcriptional regulator
MAKQYKNDILASLHDLAEGLHAVGALDKKTMRPQVAPEDIRALRDQEMISQTVLARHLNVTPGLVSQWERGEKKPSGPSLKLLSLIKHKGLEAII